jgi:predicted NUDIX family NTP pyrophosphohydrolase
MRKTSAGLLLFRETSDLELLLVHMGGPFWAKKDLASWSIPKGELADDEDPLTAARREFEEETGTAPAGEFIELEPLKQPGGKIVYAWAVKSDFDSSSLRSNTFSMEWPPKSGRVQDFPEVDRAEWFTPEIARTKILKGQEPFIDQLLGLLGR